MSKRLRLKLVPASPATSFGVSLLPMRILLWHGYLLGGTGSNVYSRALAREWSRGGHEVVVVSQERAPEQYDLGGAQAVAVDLPARLLPVFVMDRYEGLKPKFLQDFSEAERRAYVEANAAALRALLPADLVFTNHVLMGGPVGAASGAPFRVKAHGSELEYPMRGRPELGELARETLARADATYVGSEHIREVLADVVGHTDRVFDVPPGVDIDRFVLQDRGAALEDLLAEARKDPPNGGDERLPDDGNAQRLAAFLDGLGPLVVYFGKLIEEKGVQVLLEAMRGIDARLVVVGLGRTAQRSNRLPLRARCSRGRSSTVISGTCCRSQTSRWCRRSSPRRSEWSRPRPPPPGRPHSSPGTRDSRRLRPDWKRSIPSASAT